MSTEQRNRIIVGLVLVVIFAAIFIFAPNRNSSNNSDNSSTTVPTLGRIDGATLVANSPIAGLLTFGTLPSDHTQDQVTYLQVPPAGGPHHPAWQNCGVYTDPLKNEHAVHSLEHGAVWITYDPAISGDDLDLLIRITRQSTHRLLSPYSGMPASIVVTAWGYQLPLQKADDPRLLQFIAQFENGPTTPERGAVCSGGESRTMRQLGE
jgi:hypothetical protein